MNNFTFQNPVKILFGKGQISRLAEELPVGVKVMLTYGGGSIFKNGIYRQVKEALAGRDVIEFGGIEPNPKLETLIKAVALCKQEKVEFLLAVGGGSVLDGTKFIAAAVRFPGDDPWDILAKRSKTIITDALPLGSVLTLPATGSEMNGGAVISRIDTKEKLVFSSPLVMPRFSVLDPEVIHSLPGKQIANGIADAFAHVMEQYLTYPVKAPIQDRFAEGILLTLIEEGPKVLANPNDYDAAANFMWSATMALNGLISAGVPQDWSTHQIGHELTALHGIDHAQTLAIVLPGVLVHQRKNKESKLIQYGERIWGINSGTSDERIDAAIDKTVNFFESLDIKTKLTDYGVPAESITSIEERFSGRRFKLGENANIGAEEIGVILRSRI